jgi:hypothetical protein
MVMTRDGAKRIVDCGRLHPHGRPLGAKTRKDRPNAARIAYPRI